MHLEHRRRGEYRYQCTTPANKEELEFSIREAVALTDLEQTCIATAEENCVPSNGI